MHVRCGNSTMSCDFVTSVPLNADRSSGLGKGESPLLNLAFLQEAGTSSKPISTKVSARSFSYDETHTSRTTMTTVLKLWGSVFGNRWIILLEDSSAWSSMKGKNTDYSTRISKVMGVASKGDLRTLRLNTGLPKGSNTYRQRNIYSTHLGQVSPRYDLGNAKWRGRGVASLLFKRNYVSGGDRGEKPHVSLKLNKLAERSNSAPNQIIDRELYSLVSSVDMLIYAYENIKSKPGNMTQGTTPETFDGISISKEKLDNISKLLQNEKFTFCSRSIEIAKASGGSRPLSIASPMDKIVQEAIRLVLEAIYEPLFADCSHGFRPNRSCHTALKKVSQEFQPAQWVIEGDLGKFFDTISHHKLLQIIENKIKDRRFTKLIRKAMKAGYLTFAREKINIVVSHQVSIVSPILANIFLHQLDLFVLSLKESFELAIQGKRAHRKSADTMNIIFLRKEENLNQMRKLIAERSMEPSNDLGSIDLKRLVYVRYADDWIIGIKGSRQEAVSVLDKVKEFCTSIDLTLSDKTKLTSLSRDTVTFLGTEISRANHVRFSRLGAVRRLKRNKLGLRFEAPLGRIRNILASGSFISKGISAPKFLWLHLEHDQIILLYNGVMRGILNYYSFCHNYGRLASYIEFILKQSCAKLLATKFKLGTMAQTYKKYGSQLTGPKGKSLLATKWHKNS